MLVNKTVIEFLDETASNNPVPGGGSIAAHSGATAAALVEMVAGLTINKKTYENVSDRMKEIAKDALRLRNDLVKAIDQDAEAYQKVLVAYKLPKESLEEKEIRSKMIQECTKGAALIPLEVAKKSLEVIQLSNEVIQKGNKNAITDGTVSAMMARTAALSAIYNVKINLSSIKDEVFVIKLEKEIEELEKIVRMIESDILMQIKL